MSRAKQFPTKKVGIEVKLNGQNGSSAKFFWELEKSDNNTSKPKNNLVTYLSVGGITVILVGIIIALWSRRRKKIKK